MVCWLTASCTVHAVRRACSTNSTSASSICPLPLQKAANLTLRSPLTLDDVVVSFHGHSPLSILRRDPNQSRPNRGFKLQLSAGRPQKLGAAAVGDPVALRVTGPVNPLSAPV